MPRKPATRLTLNCTPGWTVGLAIATCLEGLPGYDGATLADLTGRLAEPMPPGDLAIPNADDPLDVVRALLAELAPGLALEADEKGSLRLRPAAGPVNPPTVTTTPPAPDAEATDGPA